MSTFAAYRIGIKVERGSKTVFVKGRAPTSDLAIVLVGADMGFLTKYVSAT